ncbi:MAG: hypothetical protein LBG19_13445 [Prevotellaceae bacterium]|jgi:hypothetical protein|nr:hypothetical protein [Prevotellaceae bacterium]
MLERGFLSERSKRKAGKNPKTLLIGTLMLVVGAAIIIIGFVNILSNFESVDGVVKRWCPFLIAGIALAFASFMVMRICKK